MIEDNLREKLEWLIENEGYEPLIEMAYHELKEQPVKVQEEFMDGLAWRIEELKDLKEGEA